MDIKGVTLLLLELPKHNLKVTVHFTAKSQSIFIYLCKNEK